MGGAVSVRQRHDEDNEAQGLHDVYFDVIGLSKVVWGNTGTKHLVTKAVRRANVF